MSHPLDKELGINEHEEKRVMNDEYAVKIPESPELRNLDLIIDLALKSYKEQMEDLCVVDARSKAKYLEIAERYLNQAKDAMAKKEKLMLDAQKLKLAPVAASEGQEESKPKAETSRSELYGKLKAVKS